MGRKQESGGGRRGRGVEGGGERGGRRGRVVWRKERGQWRDRPRVRKMVSRARQKAPPGHEQRARGQSREEGQRDRQTRVQPALPQAQVPPALLPPGTPRASLGPRLAPQRVPESGWRSGVLKEGPGPALRPEEFGASHPGPQEEGPSRSHVVWGRPGNRVEGWAGKGPELI